MPPPHTLNIAVIGPDRRCTRALAGLAATLTEGRAQTFTSANDAIAYCSEHAADLVLLGHPLPRGHTASFMGKLRALPAGAALPVLMLAPDASPDLRADAYAHGADAFLGLPVGPDVFATEARALVAKRRNGTPGGVQHYLAELTDALASRQARERNLFFKLLGMLVSHDDSASAHGFRVGFYARAMARALGLPATVRDSLLLAAALHDVGKVLVAPEVVGKRGRFAATEAAAMRGHPEAGRRLLAANGLPLLSTAAEIASTHHEHWDGTGYPNGIAGEAIPLAGRITAIADVFDALVTAQPYKGTWSPGQAIDWIVAAGAAQFDQQCVRAFCEQWDEILAVQAAFADAGAAVDAYLAAGVRQTT